MGWKKSAAKTTMPMMGCFSESLICVSNMSSQAMRITHHIELFCKRNTEPKRNDIHNVSKYLERCMEPDHAGEGCETNGDGAEREEYHKSKSSECGMSSHHLSGIAGTAP